MHHIVRAKASTSSDAGPLVDSREILAALREHVGDADQNLIPVKHLLQQAWSDLASVLDTELGELSPELSARLAKLQSVDRLLVDRLDERTGIAARLADAVSQLEAAPCSTEEIVTLAPQLICELGFHRAIISRVDGRLWTSECAYVPDEPEWSDAINQAGRQNPQTLGPQIHETEIVRRREGLLVTDVQEDVRVNRPIAEVSLSRSYVAAPIVSEGRVVGLLHADKYRQSGDVTGEDCQLLMGFAQSLRLALSRARMSEELATLRTGLQSITDAIGQTADEAHSVSVRRSLIPDYDEPVFADTPNPAAPRASRSRRIADAGLTARELEVLALLAQGRTNGAIAHELVISEGTVKQHVKHVLRKLQAANRSEATAFWFNENGQ